MADMKYKVNNALRDIKEREERIKGQRDVFGAAQKQLDAGRTPQEIKEWALMEHWNLELTFGPIEFGDDAWVVAKAEALRELAGLPKPD